MKKTILFFTIALTCAGLFAQPHIQAVRDITNADFVQHSVVEFASGRYVVAGTVTPGPVSGNSDILVLMNDNAGNVLWSKYVDYGQDEFVGSLMIDAAGNIVLTGYTGFNNTPNKRLIIVKLDGNGTYIDDMAISDPGYGLYGFDIEQTNAGDYIVVGTGVAAPTFSANKYGFVLKVDQGLNNIAWSHIYNSTLGVPTNLDSFNDILKVPDLPGPLDDVYLLTGSGTDDTNNYQMVVNAVIDPLGNILWFRGYNVNNGDYPYKGTMALYKDSTNEFYVMSPGLRTFPFVAVFAGNTGILNSYWEMHETPNHIVNGMVWEDPTVQDAIVFSGYRIDYVFPFPALGLGYPLLFSVDISGPPSLQWEYLYPPFSAANYQNITFDYIVQPLHYVQSDFVNQYFYQPKSLVRGESLGWTGFQFAEPREDVPNRFDLNFLNTDLSGNVDPNCMETDEEHFFVQEALQFYPNTAINPHTFSLSGSGASVFPANLATYLTCEPPPAPKPMGNNENFPNIEIYPNPARNYLQISGLSGIDNAKIALYDMQGRMALSQSYKGNETTLNISNLENGVYFVRVSSMEKTVFAERVVKE